MFEHRRNVLPLSYRRFAAGNGIMLGVGGLLLAASPFMSLRVLIVLASVFALALFVYVCSAAIVPGAFPTSNSEFLCRIDDEAIECVSPDSVDGETFKLRLSDIVKIERLGPSGKERWYLWDGTGRRYWLSDHYGNPADTFVELIRAANRRVDVVGAQAHS
jgi:hypothetical protein